MILMRRSPTPTPGSTGPASSRCPGRRARSTAPGCRPPRSGSPYDAVAWHAFDLAAPGACDALRPVLRGADAVVHLAWGFQPSRDVGYLDRLGVGGTRAVVDAAQAEEVPHLVHMSSVGAY